MSYSSMSPPQKAAPRPYSPYQNQQAGSPTNPSPYGPPPAKRQRISPDPRSPPNGAPGYGPPQHGFPHTGPYGNPYAPSSAVQSPYAPSPTYASSPQSSFNTPQPYPYQYSPWQTQAPSPTPYQQQQQQQQQNPMRQSSPPSQQSREMMPPPPRPNKDEREEKAGVEDIGDSLWGSGINLKDEENYMHNVYSNRHTQNDSFTTNPNTSFGSSTLSPNNSFNLLTQGTSFGSQGQPDGPFAGTLGQPQSQEDLELEARRKRETAAHDRAQRHQHHLNNQFLLCNNVRKRMDRLALNQGVTLNIQGVFVREPHRSAIVNGAGDAGIAATEDRVTGVEKEKDKQAESIVNHDASFGQVVSLISLAAGDRVRELMDEAFKLARARRYGDHGRVVPPDFADIAEAEGKLMEESSVVPENVTGTEWDHLPSQDQEGTPKPVPTISYPSSIAAHLRTIAQSDRDAEKARIKKREARHARADTTAEGTTDTTTTPPADGAAPTTTIAEAPKLTKKEQLKQQKEKNSSTEAQMHTNMNQTAAMMSGLGKKARKYDWMTGGAKSLPTNRFAKSAGGAASGTATPTRPPLPGTAVDGGGGAAAPALARANSGQGSAEPPPRVQEWGDWMERGEGGKGIQMRDWVLVLERDGREKGALERALGRMR